MAIRRTHKTSAPMSPSAADAGAPRRRSRSGITRSLEMVMASATLSTTTIPVAAERPPTIVSSATPCAPALSGSARTVRSRLIDPSGKILRPAMASGSDEQIDQHQIGRKQPGRGADVALVVVLDHRDVKLARQKHDRERRQQRRHDPNRGIGRRLDHRGDLRLGPGDLGQRAEPVVEPPDDESADGEKRNELDDRFDRDGENEAVLMLLGVDAPRAERHREEREQQATRRDRTRSRARLA